MARIIAIDYGKKRTGIAVTDELQLIASGLQTVETSQLFSFLARYLVEEKVEEVVVGHPKQLNNEDNLIEKDIQGFITKFKQDFPVVHVARMDERFTSKMAFQTMIDGGLGKKKRQNKALIDEISATIILQSYLAQKTN